MEPIKCFREFQLETFVDVVSREFEFLCTFGKVVDEIVAELRAA